VGSTRPHLLQVSRNLVDLLKALQQMSQQLVSLSVFNHPTWPIEFALAVDNPDTLPNTAGCLLHHKWSALAVVGEATLPGIVHSREKIKGALAGKGPHPSPQ